MPHVIGVPQQLTCSSKVANDKRLHTIVCVKEFPAQMIKN